MFMVFGIGTDHCQKAVHPTIKMGMGGRRGAGLLCWTRRRSLRRPNCARLIWTGQRRLHQASRSSNTRRGPPLVGGYYDISGRSGLKISSHNLRLASGFPRSESLTFLVLTKLHVCRVFSGQTSVIESYP